MPEKPKVAFYWCSSCGGCEEAVVDLGERLLELVEAVDVVLWPVAMDFKKKDIEAMPAGSIAVAFINGAIRTDEQVEWARLLRDRARVVIAFGSCAHLGGIPGLANLSHRAEVFETVYEQLAADGGGGSRAPREHTEVAEGTLSLPRFHDTVKALEQVVEVDYHIPGCAPPPDLVWDAIQSLLSSDLLERGAVLSPNISLCDDCPLADSKPDKLEVDCIRRVANSHTTGDRCMLADGFICLGPATRSGCGHRCIEVNQGCRGCFGPVDGVADQGAAFLSAFASMLVPDSEEEVSKLVDSIPDPTGTFYRFSMPASLLGRRAMKEPS